MVKKIASIALVVMLLFVVVKLIEFNSLKSLSNDFTPQEIRYFYEVAFFSETDQKKLKYLTKRKSKPVVFFDTKIDGEKLRFLKEAIMDLNNSLQIGLTTTKNKLEANTFISFPEDKTVLSKFRNIKSPIEDILAYTHTSGKYGKIEKAEIFIFKIPEKYTLKHILKEELVQSLGLIGDSYSYPNSLFFEAKKRDTRITDLDQRIVKLHNDKRLKPGLSRSFFEFVFKDVLVLEIQMEAFNKYMKTNSLDSNFLDRVQRSCFLNQKMVRFPNNIPITISNCPSDSIKKNLILCIDKINSLSSNFSFYYVEHSLEQEEKPKITGVHIDFNFNPGINNSIKIQSNIRHGETTMFPKRISAELSIDYKYSFLEMDYRLVYDSIFKAIGPHSDMESVFDNDLNIMYSYPQILDFIYQDFLPEGIRIDDFQNQIFNN